jgi:hypothetical protein
MKIAVKRCRNCGEERPHSEFYKNKITKDGLASWCKSCDRNRDRKAYSKSYRSGGSYSQVRERYRKSDHGRKANREYLRKQRELFPEKIRARETVNSAVRWGRVSKPVACERCGAGGRIEAHHSDYSKPLDVVWLCKACHCLADSEVRCSVEDSSD